VSFADIFLGILDGLGVTLTVTALGLLFAIPFALLAGIAQHFLKGPSRAAVTLIIEFWRSTPILVLMFMFYYSLPTIGIYLAATLVASMTLGLHIGAYGSQSVRAALQALDRGQVEAGLAIGLTRWQVLLTVELPQMIVAMLPTFVNQFIQLVKGTALVALITMTDMTHRAKEISQLTFDPPRIYTALLLAYFLLLYPTTLFGRWLERAVGRRLGTLEQASANDV
jgi:polar amino acid transport system permease protein